MRFLVDECTGARVARYLREQGYEVFSVYEEARGITDDLIIKKAFDKNWIVITNDKDFGEKVYRENLPHRGIILMRLQDERSLTYSPPFASSGRRFCNTGVACGLRPSYDYSHTRQCPA
ncbi:MAG: DUF5615 family PIN-like protein [Xenococcus sp. (in: cyanobacteria)]